MAGTVTFLTKGLGFVFWENGRRKVKEEINTLIVMEAHYINFVPYYGQSGQRTLLLKSYGCITKIGQYNLGAKKVELKALLKSVGHGQPICVIFTIYLQFGWFREQLNRVQFQTYEALLALLSFGKKIFRICCSLLNAENF